MDCEEAIEKVLKAAILFKKARESGNNIDDEIDNMITKPLKVLRKCAQERNWCGVIPNGVSEDFWK